MSKYNDDLDFPSHPDESKNLPAITEYGDSPITDCRQLKNDALDLEITEDDVKEVLTSPVERKLLLNEMTACDMYLHNIHKCFKSAASINSVIALVKAGVGVQVHRRNTLEKASGPKEDKGNTIEFDAMGNIIAKK